MKAIRSPSLMRSCRQIAYSVLQLLWTLAFANPRSKKRKLRNVRQRTMTLWVKLLFFSLREARVDYCYITHNCVARNNKFLLKATRSNSTQLEKNKIERMEFRKFIISNESRPFRAIIFLRLRGSRYDSCAVRIS